VNGDLGRMINADYREYIQLTNMNSDLKESLLRNDRVPGFVNNLVRELKKCKSLKRETIKLAVYDLTQVFITQVERHATERIMSIAEGAKLQKEIDDKNEFQRQADEWSDKG